MLLHPKVLEVPLVWGVLVVTARRGMRTGVS